MRGVLLYYLFFQGRCFLLIHMYVPCSKRYGLCRNSGSFVQGRDRFVGTSSPRFRRAACRVPCVTRVLYVSYVLRYRVFVPKKKLKQTADLSNFGAGFFIGRRRVSRAEGMLRTPRGRRGLLPARGLPESIFLRYTMLYVKKRRKKNQLIFILPDRFRRFRELKRTPYRYVGIPINTLSKFFTCSSKY